MDASEYKSLCEEMNLNPELTLDTNILSAYFLERDETTGNVKILRQDVGCGIPFDTLRVINGEPLTDSARLYDLSLDDWVDDYIGE